MLSTCSELACPPESMVQKQWQQQNVVGKKRVLKKGSNTKLMTAKPQIESSRKIVEPSLRLTFVFALKYAISSLQQFFQTPVYEITIKINATAGV